MARRKRRTSKRVRSSSRKFTGKSALNLKAKGFTT